MRASVGDVYHYRHVRSFTVEPWDSLENRFVRTSLKTQIESGDIKIEAVSPEGWISETITVTRVQLGTDTTETFDSSNPQHVQSFIEDSTKAELFKQIHTPLRIRVSPTGGVRAAAEVSAEFEHRMTQDMQDLPANPLALRESWSTGQSVQALPFGQVIVTRTATLLDLRMEGGERIAEIAETGVASFKSNEELTEKYLLRDFLYRGTHILSVARGRAIRGTAELKFVVVRGDGSDQPVMRAAVVTRMEIK